MHVSLAIHQYFTVNIWSEGGFRQRRSPSSTYFCPALDPPLGISGGNHYQNGSIPSKAFGLWSSLWLLLAVPWIHHRANLIKNLNTCAGHENFIPTMFHKHPSSGSVVKADYVCSHIYTCISASPPFLHLNKHIKISLKFFKHFNFLYQHSPNYKHGNYR